MDKHAFGSRLFPPSDEGVESSADSDRLVADSGGGRNRANWGGDAVVATHDVSAVARLFVTPRSAMRLTPYEVRGCCLLLAFSPS